MISRHRYWRFLLVCDTLRKGLTDLQQILIFFRLILLQFFSFLLTGLACLRPYCQDPGPIFSQYGHRPWLYTCILVYLYTLVIYLTRLRRSFKTCGISNTLDGLEDDVIIYDDEMPEVADDDMEDDFETDFKDVRAQKFPRTDFFKTLTAVRKWWNYVKNVKKIGNHQTRFEDKVHHTP